MLLFVKRLLAFTALLFVLASASDAHAQSSSETLREYNSGSANLPAWAEPNQYDRAEGATPNSTDGGIDGAEDPPPAPQVPLGGLEWLALAGGAYALSRMRKKDGVAVEDDGSDAPA